MNWRLEFAADVEKDILEATEWYESRQPGLGAQFVEETIDVWDALAENPLLNCRRHSTKNIRWRYLHRFPYRVIYEVDDQNHTVRVAAVLHGARHERHWQKRV
jgi:plasmid stabilization system protein ParE